MSYLIGVVGLIAQGAAVVLTVISTIITAIKGNQSSDKTEKGALRAAAGFLGISVLFALLSIISGIALASTRGCNKKNRIFFFIVFGLFIVCYIIALVIIGIYMRKRAAAGDEAGARDLRSALIMPLVAIALYIFGFILVYIFVGRRLRAARALC